MTNTVNGAAVQQPTIKKKSRAGEIWRRFRKNKLAVFGMILFALILLVAIFADAIVNYSVATTQVAADRLLSPNAEHWFGTDNYGRDLFARIVHGSRNSLLVGFGSVAIGVVLGGLLGAVCGYVGGRFDAGLHHVHTFYDDGPGHSGGARLQPCKRAAGHDHFQRPLVLPHNTLLGPRRNGADLYRGGTFLRHFRFPDHHDPRTA